MPIFLLRNKERHVFLKILRQYCNVIGYDGMVTERRPKVAKCMDYEIEVLILEIEAYKIISK